MFHSAEVQKEMFHSAGGSKGLQMVRTLSIYVQYSIVKYSHTVQCYYISKFRFFTHTNMYLIDSFSPG